MQPYEGGGADSRALSRRDLLKRAGIVGVAAAAPTAAMAPEAAPVRPRERLEALTAAEAETVEAIVDRLIPSDASGPGAAEGRVTRYIDRALGGELAPQRSAYSDGLAAVDAYAQSRFGDRFADLNDAQQDAVLTAMEQNVATGFAGGSRAFFELVREHCLQGMFGDPVHGGNEDFAGWDLIGFPGVKLSFGAAEQQMDVIVVPAHKSTADFPIFKGGRKGGRDEH
ncbi:MAG: gluconate 2-dehydrogenase subunit 3 family protein [Gaiellaceae bacterium]